MTEQEILLQNERRELCRLHAVELREHKGKLEFLESNAIKIDVALYGNGKPEAGILWMATQDHKTINSIRRTLFWVAGAIFIGIGSKIGPEILKWIASKI